MESTPTPTSSDGQAPDGPDGAPGAPPAGPVATAAAADGLSYEIFVLQQPNRARMVGFGEKDRRPADPPPIVQLLVRDGAGDLVSPPAVKVATLLCHVSLLAADTLQDCSVVVNPFTSRTRGAPGRPAPAKAPLLAADAASPAASSASSPVGPARDQDLPPKSDAAPAGDDAERSAFQRHAHGRSHCAKVLVGGLIAQCARYYNLQSEKMLCFVFSDLSLRIAGRFRLKFQLFDIGALSAASARQESLATCVSEPFAVYQPKEFPGMSESTPLSRCLSKQGARIHIRLDGTSAAGASAGGSSGSSAIDQSLSG